MGSFWEDDQKVTTDATFKAKQTPALAVHEGKLYLAWTRKADDRIYYSTYETSDGTTYGWTAPSFAHAWSTHGPALATLNGRLHMAAQVAQQVGCPSLHVRRSEIPEDAQHALSCHECTGDDRLRRPTPSRVPGRLRLEDGQGYLPRAVRWT